MIKTICLELVDDINNQIDSYVRINPNYNRRNNPINPLSVDEISQKLEDQSKNSIYSDLTITDIIKNIYENSIDIEAHSFIFLDRSITKVCKFLVTQQQWLTVMNNNPSWEKDNSFPVTNITYEEAKRFVEILNSQEYTKKMHLYFDLPSRECSNDYNEQTLETLGINMDSNTISNEVVNRYAWNRNNSFGHLHPVGQKECDSNGLFDVIGLVYEYRKMSEVGKLIGGAYDSDLKECIRPSVTFWVEQNTRYNNVGLRVVVKVTKS